MFLLVLDKGDDGRLNAGTRSSLFDLAGACVAIARGIFIGGVGLGMDGRSLATMVFLEEAVGLHRCLVEQFMSPLGHGREDQAFVVVGLLGELEDGRGCLESLLLDGEGLNSS
jgi:hypothetical protein